MFQITKGKGIKSQRATVFAILLMFLAFYQVAAVIKPGAISDKEATLLYQTIEFNDTPPPFDLFHHALAGYHQIKNKNLLSPRDIVTLIDFRLSANQKRLWVIDLKNKRLLFHSLTAHGRNSGDVFARHFSNTSNSNQSSLGFYTTGKTYIGKHGISLKLHGLEPGINDKAEARAIVMHGAEYVSESHIKKFGRLGRSFGCPAIPVELHESLIKTLANGTCLFIYYPDPHYLAQTKFKSTFESL